MIINQTIRDALIEIGVLSPLDEPHPQESQHALRTLNRIIDSYNTQNLTVTETKDIVLKLSDMNNSNTWKSCITLAPEGTYDFTVLPPIEIRTVVFRQDQTDYIAQPMTASIYESIAFKNARSIPSRYYAQKEGRNVLKLCFDEIPLDNLEIRIKGIFPYDDNYDVTQDVKWGFGFEKALMLRLAYEISSSYGVEPSQALTARMIEAEHNLKSSMYKPEILGLDLGLSRQYRRISRENRARY